jgi:hypothetical protein
MAETALQIELLQPFLEQGIKDTNFFNGRLLTAGDLATVQEASRSRDRQLGLGVGAGVVQGLEVRLGKDGSDGKPPALAVAKGLAFNQLGQAVALAQNVEVQLAKKEPENGSNGLATFALCQPPQNGQPLPGQGAYVFAARPAAGYLGQAPRRGFGQAAKVEGCDRDLLQEGVQFRLVAMDVTTLDKLAPATRAGLAQLLQDADKNGVAGLQAQNKLRNWLAHVCFGTEELAAWSEDPFARAADQFFGAAVRSPLAAYGAIDALRSKTLLGDCDVPLALVCWTQTGVKWVDMWAARRRAVRLAVGDPWSLLVDDRRLAEAEAMLVQFQRQLEEMLAESGLKSVTAMSRLRYLPAAGYLPVDIGQFDWATFFQGLAVTSEEIDLAFARLLIHRSLYLDPIDLADPAPLRVFSHEAAPGYVLFAREERQPATQPEPADQPEAPPEDAGPPETGPKAGSMTIDVSIEVDEKTVSQFLRKKEERKAARRELVGVLGANSDAQAAEAFVDKSAIKVWAVDKRGQEYTATHKSRYPLANEREGRDVVFSFDVARFVIAALPAGLYTVFVAASGYKTASQSAVVKAGKKTAIAFTLVPKGVDERDHKPGKQPEGVEAGWIYPKWYDKLYAFEKYAKWPWPPEPEIVPDLGPVIDPPPPEVDIWIEEWVDFLQVQYPDLPIDPGDVQIFIDKSYSPNEVFDDAQAYLVFGKSGLYLPVALTAKDMALDRSVSVGKAGLPGVDADVAAQFAMAGATSVEVLTAVWTGLITDVLGVGAVAAKGFIENARTKVASLQGGLQVFSGVDGAVETALKEKGRIDSPEALANADPQALVAAVGEQTLSLTMAQILVDQARGAVPKSSWSLAESSLGLKEHEVAALAKLGVATQGALKELASSGPGKDQVAAALGISTGQVDGLVGGIVIRDAATIKAGRQAEAPVTNLVGIDQATGVSLANLGFNSVGRLVTADAALLAGAFGGDQARATAAIAAARSRLGL